MRDTLSMTNAKDKASSSGLMAGSMTDTGKMENSMEGECSLPRMEKKDWENGKKERRLSGSPDFLYDI